MLNEELQVWWVITLFGLIVYFYIRLSDVDFDVFSFSLFSLLSPSPLDFIPDSRLSKEFARVLHARRRRNGILNILLRGEVHHWLNDVMELR